MSEPFIAEIIMFGGNFAPRGWALCNGQILPIAQNTALFSLLGTTYGGNGQTTFALPDLRGRVPNNQGQGPGLQNYSLGQAAGSENETLIASNIPPVPVTITVNANADSTSSKPANNFPAGLSNGNGYNNASDNSTHWNANALTGTTGGSSIPVNNIQPYLCVNFIIALEGIFPSRN